MSDNQIIAGNTTGTDTTATDTTSQVTARTYTQEEFDSHMAGLKSSLTKKLLKPYEDLGDPTELRTLKEQAAHKAQDEQMKRGEFEKVLQDLAQKKDSEISKRDTVIEQFKVEQPLLQAASEFRAVNAEQVKRLLRGSVRLNSDGDVEVIDDKGTVRYNDAGQLIQVKDLVKEFLDTNPHFLSATPATVNSNHSINANSGSVDVSKLDMKNPEHRKLYAQTKGIA
jgi:hypothetical protein